MSEEFSVDRLTKIYTKIRDKRRELQEQDDKLKEQLDAVAEKLLEICNAQGLSTMRTDYGTVSRRITKNYWTNDWDSFLKFLKENDALSLLQHRINNANMTQFLEANPDLHPPGLNVDANQTIVVTKR
jgi:malate synthase